VGRPFKKLLKLVLALAALSALAVVTHPFWMSALGRQLVLSQAPFKADIAVVLAGDGFGHRVLKGAEMVRQGYAPRVLVSGPEGLYDLNEAELAIPFAVKRGHPEDWFIPLPNQARSTREEAAVIAARLRSLGVKRVLLVTSDYHTRRAARLFRAAAPEIEFRVIAAPDEFFRADGWWHTREGQKIFILEWTKTIAAWFGF